MNDQVRTALRDLVADQGESLVGSGELLRGLLRGRYPECDREIDALTVAVEAGVPRELRDYTTAVEARVALDASILRLERGFGVPRSVGAWAVLTWASALGHLPYDQFQGLLVELGGEPSVPSGPARDRAPERSNAEAPPQTAPPSAPRMRPAAPPPPRPRTPPPPPPGSPTAGRRTRQRGSGWGVGAMMIAAGIAMLYRVTTRPSPESTRPEQAASRTSHPPVAASEPRQSPPQEPQPPGAQPAGQMPLTVAGNIQEEKLILQTPVDYPLLAKSSRIEGIVTLKAVIARDGTVKSLELASGHPLLVPAALEAVKHWAYRPTLVNGAPVEVATRIDVNFKLAKD